MNSICARHRTSTRQLVTESSLKSLRRRRPDNGAVKQGRLESFNSDCACERRTLMVNTINRRRQSSRPLAAEALPRRVALFTGAYNHIADGVSLTLNRLVRFLEQSDTEVLVFAPTVHEPAVAHAGTLVPIPSVAAPGRREYRLSLGLPASARRRLAEFRPTLFHIATPDLLGYRALKMSQRWNVPAVASYHTHFSSYLKYYGFGALESVMWKYLANFYSQCEHIYVPSPSMADVLRQHGISKGLRLWSRGVDTARFNPALRSLEWRRGHGIRDDEVLVNFTGRLVWEKGLRVYADVIEGLQERRVPHRSVIVGDGPAVEELKVRLPDTIFTGYLQGPALARSYASSDLFLFPSDTETFGNVTLEAMASGLPTVCADATGSRTLVDHGETGLLVPAGDSVAFLESVHHLIDDAQERRRMGIGALRRARNFEWDVMLSRMIGYYEDVLNPHLAPAGDGLRSPSRRIEHSTAEPVLVH